MVLASWPSVATDESAPPWKALLPDCWPHLQYFNGSRVVAEQLGEQSRCYDLGRASRRPEAVCLDTICAAAGVMIALDPSLPRVLCPYDQTV